MAVDAREHRRTLEKIAKDNVCAVCGNGLVVATNPPEPLMALRCPYCAVVNPDYRTRYEPSPFRRWRNGESLNAIEAMQVGRWLEKQLNDARIDGDERQIARYSGMLQELETGMTTNGRELVVGQPRDVLTEGDALRFMSMAKITTAGELRDRMVGIITRTGLRPDLGEIMIYENAPFIPADGWRKLLNGSKKFDGMPVPPRYLSQSEKEGRGIPVNKIAVEIALQRKDQRFPVYAIGIADAEKPHRGNVVEKAHPQIMAETRAFRRACRMGFQDLLSGWGLDDSLFGDDDDDVPPTKANVTVIDNHTGEVVSDGRAGPRPLRDDGEKTGLEILQGEWVDATPPAAPQEPTAAEMDERLVAFLRRFSKSMQDADVWFGAQFGMRWQDMEPVMRETALHDLSRVVEANQQQRRGQPQQTASA